MAVQSREAHLTGMLGSGPSTDTEYLKANIQRKSARILQTPSKWPQRLMEYLIACVCADTFRPSRNR